jgi:hypothetical protein
MDDGAVSAASRKTDSGDGRNDEGGPILGVDRERILAAGTRSGSWVGAWKGM